LREVEAIERLSGQSQALPSLARSKVIGMALLFGFFTVVLSLCVLGLCIIVLGAIWESIRIDKEFRELEQKRRRQSVELG
jgi:hypothetical protein